MEWGPGLQTAGTFGLYIRPVAARATIHDVPASVGRFEAEFFDPLAVAAGLPEPRVPQHAPGRTPSGPRGSSAGFDEAAIRAIVGKARYSDPAATGYVVQTLMARRDKILRAWLTAVIPSSTLGSTRTGC